MKKSSVMYYLMISLIIISILIIIIVIIFIGYVYHKKKQQRLLLMDQSHPPTSTSSSNKDSGLSLTRHQVTPVVAPSSTSPQRLEEGNNAVLGEFLCGNDSVIECGKPPTYLPPPPPHFPMRESGIAGRDAQGTSVKTDPQVKSVVNTTNIHESEFESEVESEFDKEEM